MHDPDNDLDQFSRELAEHVLSEMPQAVSQGGTRGAAPALDPDQFAAQLRPHLTPEVMALFGGDGAASRGLGGGNFNLKKFLENAGTAYTFLKPFIEMFTGKTLPPIPLPPTP